MSALWRSWSAKDSTCALLGAHIEELCSSSIEVTQCSTQRLSAAVLALMAQQLADHTSSLC